MDNNLVDAFRHLHPDVTPPTTYQRSNNRLDYIFITSALTPALKATGFLPFNIPFLTDHGALFANFDKTILFMGNHDNPLDQTQRKLIANNPACRDKYVEILSTLFDDHKIVEKVNKLHGQVSTDLIPLAEAITQYEKLDAQITEFMLNAEKRCRRSTCGHVWSIKLATAARTVRYWKMRKSDQLNQRDHDNYLLQLGDDLNIPYIIKTVDQIASHLTTARKHLKQVQGKAAQIRDEYLEEMATQLSKQQNTNIATIFKNIRHREEVKHSFKLL
jgi:hypothetical protein